MRHIIILDDHKKSNKAFMAIAKSIKDITVLSEKEFVLIEEEFLYREMKKAEKGPVVSLAAFKKQIAKIIGKK